MDTPRGENTMDGLSTGEQPLQSRGNLVDGDVKRASLAQATPPLVYWETPTGRSLTGFGAVDGADISASRPGPNLRRRAEQMVQRIAYEGPHAARPRMLGGITFDDGQAREAIWEGFPNAWFFLPRHLVTDDGDQQYHTVTAPKAEYEKAHAGFEQHSSISLPDRAARLTSRTPHPSREDWTSTVEELRDRIADGQFRKVVLAHSLRVDLDRSLETLECVERLREMNPDSYICLVQPTNDVMFMAATPERLVERRGAQIHTDALAGSTRRGQTNTDDERLSTALKDDSKEALEHDLVVQTIRDDLESLGAEVSVRDRRIQRLRSVQHLHTPIEAHHPGRPHALDVMNALHPTPAVGGLPRQPALEALRESETFDRGWYAAPVGWFDATGDGTFAIGIRSAVLRDQTARLFAGAGIVEESDPDAEWEELQLKYRPVLDTFAE